MDWSAVAAWGEVGGAIAVVVSLLYLSAQVRQGNRVARAAAQESLQNAFRSFTQPLASNPELYRIFDEGVERFDTLEGDERGRFSHLAFQFGKVFESAHYHYARGLLDDGSWEGWRNGLAHYFQAPGWQQYWALRSDLYSPEFRDYVDRLPVPERRATAGTIPAIPGRGRLTSTDRGDSDDAGTDS
jgi:hypothetical protein